MNGDFRIRAVGRAQRRLLLEMYDGFDPAGAAFGLPPIKEAARRVWIEAALGHQMNLAAISPGGTAVGHCFLAGDGTDSAELAIFVHQDLRRRGMATALVSVVLGWARLNGLRRVWSLTGSENEAALQLQWKLGFRVVRSAAYETELEIDLEAQLASRAMARTDCYRRFRAGA